MCKKAVIKVSSSSMTSVLSPQQNHHGRRSDYLSTTGEVQNVPAGRVYVFGNADVTEDEINTDNDVELSELRPRVRGNGKANSVPDLPARTRTQHQTGVLIPVRESPFITVHGGDEIRIGQNLYKTVERHILPGDTLQSFSLQYGCLMSEIKRINNLINDQDFHALTKIKLPVRLHGLLQEAEEEQRRRPVVVFNKTDALTTSLDSLDEEPTSPSGDESDHYYRTISIRMKDESDKRKFLKRMDKDLQKICNQTKTSKDSLDEVTKELTSTRFYPLRNSRSDSKWLSEIHCDVTWKHLVLIVILVIFGSIAAAYVFVTHFQDSDQGHESHGAIVSSNSGDNN